MNKAKLIISFLLFYSAFQAKSTIEIYSPEPGAVLELGQREVLVAASLFSVDGANQENIKLFVNNEDVTAFAMVEEEYVSYIAFELGPGTHTIRISVSDSVEREWSFAIPIPSTKAVLASVIDFHGKISAGNNYDKIDTQNLNVNQLNMNFNATAWDRVKIRSRIKMTSDESEFTQPRNIYNLDLSVDKYLEVRIGDSNPSLSEFTINGKRMRGINAHLKLGFVSLKYAEGELIRSVQGKLTPDNAYSLTTHTDSTGQEFAVLKRNNYTFQQRAWMGRIQFGTGKKFKLGMNVLHARDKISSVDSNMDDALVTWAGSASSFGLDSGKVYTASNLLRMNNIYVDEGKNWVGANPKDNLVLSLDAGLSGFNRKFFMEGEAAFSLMNNNIWDGPVSKAELDTLLDGDVDNKIAGSFSLSSIPIDPEDYSDFLIINQNLLPLVPIDPAVFDDSANVSFMDAIMGMPSLALSGKMGLNIYGNLFQIEYRQVGPEFNSFGNPYLVKNNRQFVVTDKIRLLSNRLTFGIMYKHQDDKILTSVITPKEQNTLRFTANIYPGQGFPNVSLDIKTVNRTNNIAAFDTLSVDSISGIVQYADNREHTETLNLSLNLVHSFSVRNINNTVTVNYLSMGKNDQFQNRIDTSFISPDLKSNVFNVTAVSNFPSGLKTIIGLSANSSVFSIGPGEKANQDFVALKCVGDYRLKKLKSDISLGVNYAKGSGASNVDWLGFKGGIRTEFANAVNLKFLLEYRMKNAEGSKSSSLISRALLSYNF